MADSRHFIDESACREPCPVRLARRATEPDIDLALGALILPATAAPRWTKPAP
jgi:hypothetical protein